MAVGGSELPPALEAFLTAERTLDELLELGHYRGSGEVARQLRAAAATDGERQGPSFGAFAAALFAKVKGFPEAAAALAVARSSGGTEAAADGGPALGHLVQRLEPVLRDLKQLSHPAARQTITTQLLAECLAKLEPADGAPDFRIDRYGLAVSPFAVRPSPFALHVDHHVPVACGGATEAGNLEAVQHRFNHYKRDRLIDPELHRWQILSQMARHTYVTAGQLQQLVGELGAQGKEPSYSNVMALLRCTPPWNAPYTGSSSDAGCDCVPVVRTEAGRVASGRRQRQMWSAEEEQALAFAATPRVLAALRRDGGSRRVSWEAVAAELGTGRTSEDCKGKWQRMLLRQAEDEDADGEGHQSGEESAVGSRQRQPWSETEADTAAQLLGAVGARLAADSRFELTARSLPAKLEVACQELWRMPLRQRLPGRTAAQVANKCCTMAAFAIKLARNKHQLRKQRRADRGLTPQQWQHIAPHLLRLAAQLPLKADVQQLVAGEAAREEVRRFVEDPPLQGEPGLSRLQDYWPPPAVEPGCQVLRPEEAVAAAGMAAGAGKGAAARVAAGGQRAAGRSARSTRRPAPAPAPAPAAAMLAGATSAGSLAEDVIDLTLSDSEDEGSQVQSKATPAGPARHGRPQAALAARAASAHGSSGSRSGGGGSRGSRAPAGRAALADANSQHDAAAGAAAAASKRGPCHKVTVEQREGIRQLWLQHGNQWEVIRQAVERDPALRAFLEGCSSKTQAQTKLKDLARKWQRNSKRSSGPAAATN